MQGFVDQFDFDVFFGAEVLLDFLLVFVPHVVLDTKVKTEFLVLFHDIRRQGVDFDVFEFFEVLDVFEQLFDSDVFVVLVFEEFVFELVQLLFSEQTDMVMVLLFDIVKVEILLFQLFEVLF